MKTSKTPDILIHHLTDIHIGPLHYAASRKLPFINGNKTDGRENVSKYLDHLKDCQAEKKPDLVIISGDLTSYATEEEFNRSRDMIHELCELLESKALGKSIPEGAPRILIVPGNHDLDWSKDSYSEKIERYARLSDGLSGLSVLSAVYLNESRKPFFDYGDTWNLAIYLINTTPLGGTNDPKLERVHKKLKEVYQQLESKEPEEKSLDELEEYIKQDPGYVTKEDLDALKEEMRNISKQRFKIAVMHHNPTSVPSDDIETFDTIINAGMVKNRLLEEGFDVILHGHRHFAHSTNERYLRSSPESQQGIYVIGGDSLGCKEAASFLQIGLHNTEEAHKPSGPSSLVVAHLAEHRSGVYGVRTESVVEEAVDRPIHAAVRTLAKNIGRESEISGREELIQSLNAVMPPLKKLQSTLLDWGGESIKWIREFHFNLDQYSRVYAMDAHERSSFTSSHFQVYLSEQFEERLRRLRSQPDRKLRFSKPVYDAIVRTEWSPHDVSWSDWEIEQADFDISSCEIVRVLIRASENTTDKDLLRKADFDHRIFAVPLFVIDADELPEKYSRDVAIGFNDKGDIQRCYEYEDNSGRVKEVNRERAKQLADQFEEILNNRGLRTVEQHLSRLSPTQMFSNHEQQKEIAEVYDQTRKSSPQILEILKSKLKLGPQKTGLDIGCGTGNYTVPFAGDFQELIGIDICEEMLNIARKKNESIRWVGGDALKMSKISDEYCHSVWCISALHYFRGKNQKLLFKEIHRVLKKGGVFVADTEFKEQHESLWLMEFFPSLRERYKYSCLPTNQYLDWLNNLGFHHVEFETSECQGDEDGFLRVGQRDPKIYLKEEIRNGIPAFVSMKAHEREEGLKKLRDAIENQKIEKIMQKYKARAEMPGDIGFVIATK